MSGVFGVVEVDVVGVGFEDQNIPTTRRTLPFTRPGVQQEQLNPMYDHAASGW